MFNNPISYAGYPPNVTGKANKTNSTVRAATAAEATAGTKTNVYITPATFSGPSVAPSVSGATPLVNNSRYGQVSYTNIIAITPAYFTYVLTNSLITANSVIQADVSCSTVNTALGVVGIVPSAGSVSFRVYNSGTAASVANVIINYEIYN